MAKCSIGQPVTVVDSVGKRHHGLITNVFGVGTPEEHKEKYGSWPCVNVVFVSEDEDRKDTFGRQIERFTSFSHKSSMPGVHGMFYLFPDEA